MALFRKQARRPPTTGTPLVGLYGKHPSCGDFIRHNCGGPELARLDGWLSAAIDTGRRLLPTWEQDYASVLAISFLLHPWDEAAGPWSLLGIVAPSQDNAGRRFPLVLFAQLERAQALQHYAALPHDPFLESATRLFQRRNALGRDELLREVARLAPPDAKSLQQAAAAQRDYLTQTSFIAACATMFGLDAPAQQGKAVGTLRQVVASVRGGARPRYGVRCPLGRDPAGNAGFWLELLRREARRPVQLDLLWTANRLLIYFERAAPRALAALLSPGWQHDSIYDVCTATGGAEHARLPLTDCPLWDLLQAGERP